MENNNNNNIISSLIYEHLILNYSYNAGLPSGFSPELFLFLTLCLEIGVVSMEYKLFPSGGRHLSAFSLLHIWFFKNFVLTFVCFNILQDIFMKLTDKLVVVNNTFL
jgi:hypothetical protein